MVVAVHLGRMLQHQDVAPSLLAFIQRHDWFADGEAGVDIFFVISGFVITYATPRALVSLRDVSAFLLRRCARIYPAYWALSLPLLAWRYWKADPATLPHGHLELAAWIFLLPYTHVPPLRVAWTLVFEVFFYVAAALIFIWPLRWRKYLAAAWLTFLLTVAFLPLGSESWYYDLRVYTSPFPIEFIGGMFIAFWLMKRPSPLSPSVAAVLFVMGFVSMPLLGSALNGDSSTLLRVAAFGPGAWVIVWVVVQMDALGKWEWFKYWTWLGDRSYSLYLLHLPILNGLYPVAIRLLPKPNAFELAAITLGIFAVLAVAIDLSYRFIEKPMQKAAKHLAPHTELKRKKPPEKTTRSAARDEASEAAE